MAIAALVAAAGFTGCSSDDLDTNQYNKSGVNILGFGPMPITRGETMRLTGTKLDKVREVLFPEGNQKLTPATTFITCLWPARIQAVVFLSLPVALLL